jgi:hypothetical protein
MADRSAFEIPLVIGVSFFLGAALGVGGYWGYNKLTVKAETALDANTSLVTLVQDVKTQQAKLLEQNKAIAPGVLQANKALIDLRGKVSEFKDLDVCIVSDDLARLLDFQLDAYDKNRTPSKSRIPKN